LIGWALFGQAGGDDHTGGLEAGQGAKVGRSMRANMASRYFAALTQAYINAILMTGLPIELPIK
jgi:hypothetical protein